MKCLKHELHKAFRLIFYSANIRVMVLLAAAARVCIYVYVILHKYIYIHIPEENIVLLFFLKFTTGTEDERICHRL